MLTGESILTRHGDKGSWSINDKDLRDRVSDQEANLVLSVLNEEFPGMTETPLKLEGIVRSLRLGDELFDQLPKRAILVSVNSGKDRAKITNALATARIGQRETQHNNTHKDDQHQIDILQVEASEIVALLADSDDSTWPPYAKMINDEGISEFEAIARWLNDMNTATEEIQGHPRESAERYRQMIMTLKEKITSEQVPVVVFGVGHSGSLGQIGYEDGSQPTSAKEVPNFCEMFIFDEKGKLTERNKIDL